MCVCIYSKSYNCKQGVVEIELTTTSRLAEFSTPPSRCHDVRKEEESGIENSDFKPDINFGLMAGLDSLQCRLGY